EDALDLEPREHDRDGEHVREMRRIEAAAEDPGDPALAHASPCTRIFVARVVVSVSFCIGLPDESKIATVTSSPSSSSTASPPPAAPIGPGVTNHRAPIFFTSGPSLFP